jgi:protein N-terminal methyltransferase
VTGNVLIHLLDTVEVLEPAPHFLDQAVAAAPSWKGLGGEPLDDPKAEMAPKAARFWRGGLSKFDPADPWKTADEQARFGAWDGVVGADAKGLQYDVVWCQWCLGHCA